MASLPGRIGSLNARDVMTRDVIVIKETDAIQSAVGTLKREHITGAPVVGQGGKFVGILSLADLVHLPGSTSEQTEIPPVLLADGDDTTTWDLFDRANLLDAQTSVEQVKERMSRRVTSVTEEALLVDVARVMCRGHWHRVPVVDDSGALCGIISTMDILAALVNAADERG